MSNHIATPEEVEELKRQWANDPIYDIWDFAPEEQERFMPYIKELTQFQADYEKQQEMRREAHELRRLGLLRADKVIELAKLLLVAHSPETGNPEPGGFFYQWLFDKAEKFVDFAEDYKQKETERLQKKYELIVGGGRE